MAHERVLVVVCQESPLPTNHGGRIDVWRRLLALKASGVKTHLICWSETPNDAQQMTMLKTVCESVHVFGYRRGLIAQTLKLACAPWIPAPAVSRRLAPHELRELVGLLEAYGPVAVMQDGLMAGPTALALSRRLKVPFFVRSHNIEHQYWLEQFKLARGAVPTIRIAARLMALKGFESRLIRQAAHVFDISADDAAYWQAQGVRHVSCVPPIAWVDPDETPVSQQPHAPDHDIAFIGNLRMPNNVDGLLWFMSEVLPRLAPKLGREPTLLVAGSGPVAPVLLDCLSHYPNATLLVDFESLPAVLARARVFINPMRSGSGVALKSLDMLKTGRPLISTKQGVMGLPVDIKALAHVQDDPAEFARSLMDCVLCDQFSSDQARKVLDVFGPQAVTPLLKAIDDVL